MDSDVRTTPLGTRYRVRKHPNLRDGATVMMFGGVIYRNVRYDHPMWEGELAYPIKDRVGAVTPAGTTLRFVAAGVWFAFDPDKFRDEL